MNFDSRVYFFSRAFEIEFKIQIYSAMLVANLIKMRILSYFPIFAINALQYSCH